MAVTLKTIAEETGYSITTVSRALAGYDDVAEETRQLILETAERLGYRPNEAARQLRFRRANTIGLVVPTFGPRFSDPFFSEFLAGVGNQASEQLYDLLVATQAPGPDELSAYRRMEGGRVDGVLLIRTRQQDARIRYLLEHKIPFVAFGRSNIADSFPYIDVDGELGMRLLVQHLIDFGHRRIGYVSPPPDLNFAQYRIAGYRKALEENGLPYDETLIVPGDMTQQGGTRGAEILLDHEPPPTALLAGNDTMAFGIMRAIRQRGIRVGADIAVGGFDDIPDAEYANPPLTTLRQPIYEIGSRACQMLIRLCRGETLPEPQIILQPELIIRESSGSPRDK